MGRMLYEADGYVTAWFCWQLRDDPVAARAFLGADAELPHNPLYRDSRCHFAEGGGSPLSAEDSPAGQDAGGSHDIKNPPRRGDRAARISRWTLPSGAGQPFHFMDIAGDRPKPSGDTGGRGVDISCAAGVRER